VARKDKDAIEAFRCQMCNAPLAVSPDDVVVTCQFCGYTATIEGDKIEKHFVLPPTFGAAEVREKVRKWVGRGGKAQVTEAVLRFVPYWVESLHAVTRYEGYKEHKETRTRRDASGEEYTETVTFYEPVKGTIDERRSLNILGRRGATFYSQDELDQALQLTKQDIKPFNFKDITAVESRPTFLNCEITEEDAFEMARTAIAEEHRQRAEAATTKCWDCHTQVRKLGSYLLHIPHWLVRYRFGTETYRVGIDGYTKKVLKGEVPVSTAYRAIMFLLSFIGLAIGAIGAQALALITEIEVLGFAAIIGGLVLAVVGMKETLKISAEKRE